MSNRIADRPPRLLLTGRGTLLDLGLPKKRIGDYARTQSRFRSTSRLQTRDLGFSHSVRQMFRAAQIGWRHQRSNMVMVGKATRGSLPRPRAWHTQSHGQLCVPAPGTARVSSRYLPE